MCVCVVCAYSSSRCLCDSTMVTGAAALSPGEGGRKRRGEEEEGGEVRASRICTGQESPGSLPVLWRGGGG